MKKQFVAHILIIYGKFSTFLARGGAARSFMGFLIFTDLDGTLLDHQDYSWVGAKETLAEIKRRQIPLIFVTSKTRAELMPFRKSLDNTWPFITENGGAVFFPMNTWTSSIPEAVQIDQHMVLILGRQYSSIREIFEEMKNHFPIEGFGDMTDGEIAAHTGLAPDEAALARQREFSEPFLLKNPDKLEALTMTAEKYGCSVTRGGRFYHLIDKKQNKGKAVKAVIASYVDHFGNCVSIGLGDSKNDLPMLNNVEIPVLIAKPDGRYEDYETQGLIRSPFPGSRGWGQSVMEIISRIPAAAE